MLTNKELKHVKECLELCEKENDENLIKKFKDLLTFFTEQRQRLEFLILELITTNNKIN